MDNSFEKANKALQFKVICNTFFDDMHKIIGNF